MQDGELANPKLELLITELAEHLRNNSGKKVYGYLPPATKRIVDAIVDELASDERIAEAYSLWQDMRDEVFSFYSKAKPKRAQYGHPRGRADDGTIATPKCRAQ